MPPAATIDDVVQALDDIIANAKLDASRLGYFAALYRRVTLSIKEGIALGIYEDPDRMEQLDVIFANRYLAAYDAYQNNGEMSDAWKHAFDVAGKWWPVVGQHLVLGINVHINLDLGIAAAETVHGSDIEGLKNDFFKINRVLKSMINEVEKDLARIWWPLRVLDFLAGRLDEYLARFGIEYARDHAWDVAEKLSALAPVDWAVEIDSVDQTVLKIAQIIEKPSFLLRLILIIMRITEFKRVPQVIKILER